ncbi:NUDIX hydrolase [Virgibacillus sp. W0181]|uniref:NUDIX hydrolase n=1 Tax=Virgibacillus sp. W0181 TaxID=3391581 RepID=UPI003F48CDEB
MQKFMEKTIERQLIYDGKIIQVHVDKVMLPNGKTSYRELVNHPGAVAIIPITSDQNIVFVEQYRKPLERSLLEIPAGKLEQGEEPEITAVRELEEETGYTTDHLQYVTSFYTSPGFANELIHIYMTNNIHPLKESVQGDDDEFVEIVEMSLEEAKKATSDKRIYDAKTIYALTYLEIARMNQSC